MTTAGLDFFRTQASPQTIITTPCHKTPRRLSRTQDWHHTICRRSSTHSLMALSHHSRIRCQTRDPVMEPLMEPHMGPVMEPVMDLSSSPPWSQNSTLRLQPSRRSYWPKGQWATKSGTSLPWMGEVPVWTGESALSTASKSGRVGATFHLSRRRGN